MDFGFCLAANSRQILELYFLQVYFHLWGSKRAEIQ